jgi:beta-glucosidase
MGVEYIQAVQKKRVAACVKHYLANSRDDVRHFNSSNMDERTLREMYLVPFEMAVTKANVWTLMTGNNLFDGVHVSENKRLVQGILKNELGFDGVVFTDWRAAYTAEGAANAGTDITSGLCAYVFGDTVDGVLDAVRSGKVSEAVLDDKVRRILRLYDRTGLLGNTSKQKGSLNTEEHKTAARELAAEGMVLLKNEKGILPVRPESARRILITGPAADTVSAGTGSSLVKATEQRTPLKLLTETYSTNRLTFVPYEQIGSKAMWYCFSPGGRPAGRGRT